ncbi:EthD family reductase [Glaciecola sp. SC05]|uniref:EthD family reductase n=1 Tax=Glaciecola sp. SC05 TaxID=1987355 RepID=UPI003529B27C
MSQVTLMVLYPQPSDPVKFEQDYQAHLALFHSKMDIPSDQKPYKVTKMMPGADGLGPYYQMFSFVFPSLEVLQGTLSSAPMQIVAADANRISSGGAPVMIIGTES